MKARTSLTKIQRERLERFLGSMSRGIAAAVAADEVERILGIPSRAIYALDSEAGGMRDRDMDACVADLKAGRKAVVLARAAGTRGPLTTSVRIPIVGRERLRRSRSA